MLKDPETFEFPACCSSSSTCKCTADGKANRPSDSPAQGLLLPNPSPCAVQHISEATSKQNPHCTQVKSL